MGKTLMFDDTKIEDDDWLNKCNTNWDKASSDIKKEFVNYFENKAIFQKSFWRDQFWKCLSEGAILRVQFWQYLYLRKQFWNCLFWGSISKNIVIKHRLPKGCMV